MKVLHITPIAPAQDFGGSLGIYQTMYSLTEVFSHVDYIGPEIMNIEIINRYRTYTCLRSTKNIWELFQILIQFQNNKSFMAWKKLEIDFSKYDFIFIDSTKPDYVLKDIKKKNVDIPVVVRVHNIEFDYAKADWKANKSLKNLYIFLTTRKKEQYLVRNAKNLLVLTNEDKKRISDIYNVTNEKMHVVPVCINRCDLMQNRIKNAADRKVKMLLTGSLWFGPNVEGAIWFLENVVPKITVPYSLKIAGANPNDKLVKKCKQLGVELVDSPADMAPFFEECDLVVVPIFSGAGMKVKIAEAMSYGRPVICTGFGCIGYDLTNNITGYIAKTPDDFLMAIQQYYNLEEVKKEEFSQNVFDLYKRKYSLEASVDIYKKEFSN